MASPSSDPYLARFEMLSPRERRRLIVRSLVVTVSVVVVLVAAYYVVPWGGRGPRSVLVQIGAGLTMLVVATIGSVRGVTRSDFPMLRAVEGLGLVVGIAVVTFASVYVVISSRDISAFTEPLGKTDGLYFSLTTATTIGYGDISALTETARVVVMLQMVTNVVVLGAAARLIVNSARRKSDER